MMENADRFIKTFYYEKVKGGIHNMTDILDRIEKIGADKKEKEMNEDFAKREEELKENFAKRMLAAGKPQDEVVAFSGLSKLRVSPLAKLITVATV